MFAKAVSYVSRNRQAVVNMVGMYFMLSYAVYNYKVKLAWEDLQVCFPTFNHIILVFLPS